MLALCLLAQCLMTATIIDQIAVIVGSNSIVKDSDIERDIRVTSFLNGQPLNLNNEARKAAANRLIDQIFIRKEIELGDYPSATLQDADAELTKLEGDKYRTQGALDSALRRYGITAPDLRFYFEWQLTILRFVDVRFRPAAMVTDAEVEKYYQAHQRELAREHPGKASLDNVRREIENDLSAKQVDQLFFNWLDDERKQTKIQYLEEGLR